jgi:hypothetical protein
MLADITRVPAIICGIVVVVLAGTATINGVENRLLPEAVQAVLTFVLVWGTVYYQYQVNHLSYPYLVLLAAPIVIGNFRKISKRWFK